MKLFAEDGTHWSRQLPEVGTPITGGPAGDLLASCQDATALGIERLRERQRSLAQQMREVSKALEDAETSLYERVLRDWSLEDVASTRKNVK